VHAQLVLAARVRLQPVQFNSPRRSITSMTVSEFGSPASSRMRKNCVPSTMRLR
jgi:hypothetical protein